MRVMAAVGDCTRERRASLANKKARVVPEPLAVTRSLSCRFLFERCGVRPAGEEIRQIEAVTNAE